MEKDLPDLIENEVVNGDNVIENNEENNMVEDDGNIVITWKMKMVRMKLLKKIMMEKKMRLEVFLMMSMNSQMTNTRTKTTMMLMLMLRKLFESV